jgi:hypothetical protein
MKERNEVRATGCLKVVITVLIAVVVLSLVKCASYPQSDVRPSKYVGNQTSKK